MVTLTDHGVFLNPDGTPCASPALSEAEARRNGMAWRILEAHNHSGNMEALRLKFDALVSPDNNYVSILQTARASGMERFPVPYVLSNCHNTLCGVGGTINEDDHMFGLDNARRYGGIFVPRYRAVLHQYMREMMASCGKMILGSDSHTAMVHWAPWASARAAVRLQSSCSAAPMTLPARPFWQSSCGALPGLVSAPWMWRWP